jgi:hypothetical protein
MENTPKYSVGDLVVVKDVFLWTDKVLARPGDGFYEVWANKIAEIIQVVPTAGEDYAHQYPGMEFWYSVKLNDRTTRGVREEDIDIIFTV